MITVNEYSSTDFDEMAAEVWHSKGALRAFRWLNTVPAERFLKHFETVLEQPHIEIFTVRVAGRLVGAIETNTENTIVFIGYWLGMDFRGQGIMTQAVAEYLKTLKPKTRVIIRVPHDNLPSHGVPQRLNFRRQMQDKSYVYYSHVV